MTPGQQALRKKLLARIHQHPFCMQAKKLDTWGSYLVGLYGVESSARLSIDELYGLLGILEGKREDAVTGGQRPTPKGAITTAQRYKIETLWAEKGRDKSKEAMMRFVHKIIKRMPLHLSGLSVGEASRVLSVFGKL